MVSGRGLGHTGGTVDKLESVPGLRMDLSPADMQRALADEDIGFFMAQQTPTFCPADRVMYRTRDVTSTVSSVHLVTASIMSKKLAEDLDALVLDAKVCRGLLRQIVRFCWFEGSCIGVGGVIGNRYHSYGYTSIKYLQ